MKDLTREEKFERARGLLSQLGHHAVQLADSLKEKGRRLSRDEEVLLRMAQLPILQEAMDVAAAKYLAGVPPDAVLADLANVVVELL